MKKVIVVLAAALFLGACHCQNCTTKTAGSYVNRPASRLEHTNSNCKCSKCAKAAPAPAPVVAAKPAPAPTPAPVAKVEDDAAVAEVANVKKTDAGLAVLSFKEPINFKYNSDELDEESVATVDKVAAILKKYPNAHIRVAGYTDSLGNPNYNMDLSERRAHSVATRLVQDGVPAANVSYIGFGSANPVATNKTAAGRYQNRRVELEISQQ